MWTDVKLVGVMAQTRYYVASTPSHPLTPPAVLLLSGGSAIGRGALSRDSIAPPRLKYRFTALPRFPRSYLPGLSPGDA